MQLTGKIVAEKKVTTIMVTHNLRYAVEYGDRLIDVYKRQDDQCFLKRITGPV